MIRRLPRPLASVLLLALGATCQAPAPAAAGVPPRLIVFCSVDQLATWVFEQALPHLGDHGFKRLLRNGVGFDECAYLHGCTETGPGHATLGTGVPAKVHGIVHNEWYDPASKGKIYCASDPAAAALPECKEGAGRGPARLLVPTFGDRLKQQYPAAKVVSVSMKDRSAILMAGRSADAVAWFEYSTGRFVTNATWGKQAPKWLLEFEQRKAVDGFFGWTWDRSGPASAYVDCIDDRPFEMPHTSGGGRTLPVVVNGGKDEPEPVFWLECYLSPIGNELTLQLAEAALAAEQLGKDAVPDLLCVSFSSTDTVGHYYGAESVEARDTMLRLDALLAKLLLRLDQQVGAGNYAFLLSADHGVGPTVETVKAKGGSAGRALLTTMARNAAEQQLKDELVGTAGRPFVAWASEQSLFLDRELVGKHSPGLAPAAALLAACKIAAAAAQQAPHVQHAFVTSELIAGEPDDDPIRAAMWNATHPDRAGDVLLVFEPNWIEGPIVATHGSPHPYDRRVPLLATGPGLARGRRSKAAVSPGLMVQLAARMVSMPSLEGLAEVIPAEVLSR